MPRLSMWRENHSNDYKFFDRRISEEFTVGGTGIYLHKYVGTFNQATAYAITSNVSANTRTLTFANVSTIEPGQAVSGVGIAANTYVVSSNTTSNTVTISSNTVSSISTGNPISTYWLDTTRPYYATQSAQNIQDLLFLENRDRKYDTSIYSLRGIYTVNDNDFDLSQFGLFLNSDTLYITFHLTDTVASLGRKIMSGDVIELLHKKDYYPLDASIPAVLKRFYVVQEASFASEGFSQTWWPHLWRVKCTPLVDAQEYKDILNNISASSSTNTPLGQVISTLDKLNQINDAIIQQAVIDVPLSGTDTDTLYIEPILPDGSPGDPTGLFADNTQLFVSSTQTLTDSDPTTPATTVRAYLSGDTNAPNGFPVTASTSFPTSPSVGDYVLRTDYVPNRLFRFDGTRWTKIDDNIRADLTPGANNKTQRSIFVNDSTTFVDNEGKTQPTRQSLSKALTLKADN